MVYSAVWTKGAEPLGPNEAGELWDFSCRAQARTVARRQITVDLVDLSDIGFMLTAEAADLSGSAAAQVQRQITTITAVVLTIVTFFYRSYRQYNRMIITQPTYR